MRNTAQFFRIKWKGYNLKVEANASDVDEDGIYEQLKDK
jgi:hypothetical protein